MTVIFCIIICGICILWVNTLYLIFIVYDKDGFNSHGYNRFNVHKSGLTKEQIQDIECVYNIKIYKEYTNDTCVQFSYSRLDYIPSYLPFATLCLFAGLLKY